MQQVDQGDDCSLADLPEGPGSVPPGLSVWRSQDMDEGFDRGRAVLRHVQPCLGSDEVLDRAGIIGRVPPDVPENFCGSSPGVPVRSVKGRDKERDRLVADLLEHVAGTELHLIVIIGKHRNERWHGGSADTHERCSCPGLYRIIPERGNKCRDRFFAYRGEGFGNTPPLPVVCKREGLYQGSHGSRSAPCNGIHGTFSDPGIITAQVVNE